MSQCFLPDQLTTAAKKHVLAPGPGLWLMALVSADQSTPGTEASTPSSLGSPRTPYLSRAMHLAEQAPRLCATKRCGSSPHCSLRAKRGAKPRGVKDSHAQGNFDCGRHGLKPTRQTPQRGMHEPPGTGSYAQPNVFPLFLNETVFVTLPSQYAVLIDIYWALRDPSLLSLAWLIGIIEQRLALAGWDSLLWGRSSPAHPGLLLHSLAPVRLN